MKRKVKKNPLFTPKADLTVSIDTFQCSSNILVLFKHIFDLYRNEDIELFLAYDVVLSEEELWLGFEERGSLFFLVFLWLLISIRFGFHYDSKNCIKEPVYYKKLRNIPYFNYSKIESSTSLRRRFLLLAQDIKVFLLESLDNYTDSELIRMSKHLAAHKLYNSDYFVTNNEGLLSLSIDFDRLFHISIVSVDHFTLLSTIIFPHLRQTDTLTKKI